MILAYYVLHVKQAILLRVRLVLMKEAVFMPGQNRLSPASGKNAMRQEEVQ